MRMNQGSRHIGKRRRHLDRHVVQLAQLDRPRMHDPGAKLGQLEHLFVANFGELARVRHHPRIGRVDAFDVGVDVAALGAERAGQRDRGGIRAAATKRGDVLFVGHALKSGDDDDFALLELGRDALGVNIGDARSRKHARRTDASLSAVERNGRLLQLVQAPWPSAWR